MQPGAIDNDVHSGLNACRHAVTERPRSLAGIRHALARAAAARLPLAVAGGRHAMGGQQFVHDGVLLDMSDYKRVGDLDSARGLLRVGGGAMWPDIHRYLHDPNRVDAGWAIRQKQTGADSFSIGGSLASNVHGRGLDMPPLAADVESCRMVLADGLLLNVNRQCTPELFSAAVGGYGLFGVVESVTLRLARRRKLERQVDLVEIGAVESPFAAAIDAGDLYGDFQFAVDPHDDGFLQRGIFSRYRPLPDDADMPPSRRKLDERTWHGLMYMAHHDKRAAFDAYSRFYLSTAGQRYASDAMQMSIYPAGYHRRLDAVAGHAASELITELYVPPRRLATFMQQAAGLLRRRRADVIYGTVRRTRADRETMLPWARTDCFGIIFNLHVIHEPDAIGHVAETLRQLIDLAIDAGGNYYLTYHGHARADQVRACYPRIDEWLAYKAQIDPHGLFASNWYRNLLATLGRAAPHRHGRVASGRRETRICPRMLIT